MMEDPIGSSGLATMLERTSLCVSGPTPGVPQHDGDTGFRETVQQHYSISENNAVEKLVLLKAKLGESSTFDFWRLLMEGMTTITGAQYGFVSKRILVDDQNSAVEMPPIGEPGSCLLAVAFYYNDGHQIENLHRDYKYLAYGAPCHNMKHDKVFLIPSGLPTFVTNNPNQFPFPTEAYLGVPLFAEGKCFAHFGMMWTVDGLTALDLGWAFVEMLLHSLEDIILHRLLEGQGFAKTGTGQNKTVIPAEAVTAAQSLKPYARSLSHELRTPMQGVVGMLDVMHATVQESLEGQSDAGVREIFKTLRDNIEVVQDSSRRAVEAADNVVHAYDLNMQVPDTPTPHRDDESMGSQSPQSPDQRRPGLPLEGKSIFFRRTKRPRTSSAEWEAGPTPKHRMVQSTNSTPHREVSPHTASLRTAVEECDHLTSGMEGVLHTDPDPDPDQKGKRGHRPSGHLTDPEVALHLSEPDAVVTSGLRHTNMRELLHLVVNESLRVGGRPESTVAEETEGGERIEVRTRNSQGNIATKMIEWSVDAAVPETIFVDERDLTKLISCVFLNAVKFTDCGQISLQATLVQHSRSLSVKIIDTGPGIPPTFIPNLFKAFSREDDSLTRQKEGLGLGLLVAKGLARKLRGDLTCTRSDTTGPLRGSEFEVRVPIAVSDTSSKPSTPAITPARTYASAEEPLVSSPRGRQPATTQRRRASHNKGTSAAAQKTPDPAALVKAGSPLVRASPSRRTSLPHEQPSAKRRPSTRRQGNFDRNLSKKYPLTFLVAEDNTINRKLLVNMLCKFGYTDVHEAYDGADAVRQMSIDRAARREKPIDVVLMDLWMPQMDGYEATKRILAMEKEKRKRGIRSESDDDRARRKPNNHVMILAVSADVTDSAVEKAHEAGMAGFLTKPYKLMDLERLIIEYCSENP